MQDFMKLADDRIEGNKPIESVKEALDMHYKQDHRKVFDADMRAEYDSLDYFEDIVLMDAVYDENDEEIAPATIETRLIQGMPTFDEWLNETIVVEEAVVDDDGKEIEPEKVEYIRDYIEPLQKNIDALVNTELTNKAIELRKIAYAKLNQDEMRFDDEINGTTTRHILKVVSNSNI